MKIYSWEPSLLQTQLVQVSLAPSGCVEERWKSFLAGADLSPGWLSQLEWGTRRLLPLVGWRLGQEHVDDAAALLFRRELAKSMWVSRVRRAEYKRVLTNLAAEGIDVLVLKGVALGSLVYPDVGTRPSSDLDVFVGPDGYDATMNYLQTNHPQNYGDESRGIPKVRHSRGAVIDGYAVDIHWRLLWDRYDDQPDRELHARSIELPLGDTALRTIGLEDHLLHAIVHGLRPNHLSSVRWVVDSALLIGTGLIRWDLFRQIVCDRRVGGVVARGLGLLRENFDVEVPAGLIEQLSHADTRMWNWADNLPRVNHRLRVQNYLSQYVAAYILGSWNWSVRDKAIRYREFITSILEGGEAHRLEQSGFLPKPVLSLPAGSEWLG